MPVEKVALFDVGVAVVEHLAEEGIEPNERAEIPRVIYEELCQGQFLAPSRQRYLQICQSLIERGAQGIILGCTEIALLLPPATTELSVPLFDTTLLHAQGAADWALQS